MASNCSVRRLQNARSAKEMDAFYPDWERTARDSHRTLFQHFAWNRLAGHIFAAGHPPFVVKCESDSGVAIIPACLDTKQGRISLLGEELFDYRDVLHVGDPDVLLTAWDFVFGFAAKNNFGFGFHSFRSDWPIREWCGLPLSPFTHAPCAHSRGAQQVHPHLDVNLRRLLRAGVTRNTYSGTHTQLLQHIYSLKSLEPNSLFRDSRRIQMLIGMALSAAQRCEIFTLESGSTLIATLVTFRDHHWRRFYTTYFNRAWAKHSPGITLLNLVMQESLSSGLDCDLMTGDQQYKSRLANHATPLYRVSVSAEEIRSKGYIPVAAAI